MSGYEKVTRTSAEYGQKLRKITEKSCKEKIESFTENWVISIIDIALLLYYSKHSCVGVLESEWNPALLLRIEVISMFKSVKINNLRAITKLEIDNLGMINLFVGQNNCGKTTILEAIFFLVGQTNPKLPINVNIFRGLDFFSNEYWCTFFNNMNIGSDIRISAILCDTQTEQRLIIRPETQKQIPTKPV